MVLSNLTSLALSERAPMKIPPTVYVTDHKNKSKIIYHPANDPSVDYSQPNMMTPRNKNHHPITKSINNDKFG